MLPYDTIWDLIDNIHESYEMELNLRHTYDPNDKAFIAQVVRRHEEFTFHTLEYIKELVDILDEYEGVDFTFRYKDPISIVQKMENQTISKSLNKVINDALGLRFIINCDTDTLHGIALKLEDAYPITEGNCRVVDQTEGKRNDDGYKGIHVYSKFNNSTFPVEIQFWTRVHALLNEYLHDNIYKTGHANGELDEHALELRDWLEAVPTLPNDFGVQSYVDFLYERKNSREGDNNE